MIGEVQKLVSAETGKVYVVTPQEQQLVRYLLAADDFNLLDLVRRGVNFL